MKKLPQLLAQLETAVPQWEMQQEDVSSANIGWHIEHSLLTLDRIIVNLQATDPRQYIRRNGLAKFAVMGLGRIPRGKARSPKAVIPGPYNEASLQAHLAQTRERLEAIQKLPDGHYFEHPIFGHLRKKKTFRFMQIHTAHHLQIIRDILKK